MRDSRRFPHNNSAGLAKLREDLGNLGNQPGARGAFVRADSCTERTYSRNAHLGEKLFREVPRSLQNKHCTTASSEVQRQLGHGSMEVTRFRRRYFGEDVEQSESFLIVFDLYKSLCGRMNKL